MKTWGDVGAALAFLAMLTGFMGVTHAQSNVQVRMWLGTPSYTAGEFRVPLDYTWRSTGDVRKLARLKVDFSATRGWLTDHGQTFSKIRVLTTSNSGWSVEKPLGVSSNYAFEFNGQQFSGTWGAPLLVLRNDALLSQKPSDSWEPGALGFLENPWVLAGIVAAAIAIPLAIDAYGDESNGYYEEDGADVTVDPAEVVIDPLSLTSIRQGPDDRAVIQWVSLTGMTYTTYVQTQGLAGSWVRVSSNVAARPPENTWTDKVPRLSPSFFRVGATIPP